MTKTGAFHLALLLALAWHSSVAVGAAAPTQGGTAGGPAAPPPRPSAEAPVPDIESFMQIGACWAPQVTPDGRTLFFMADMSGAPQLYRLTDEGWPYRLTSFADGIDFYRLSPDGSWAVVGAGRGGDEQSQLYLLDAATGTLSALTERPEVKYGSPFWSPAGDVLYYQSTEVNGRDFHIYARELATGKTRRIFEHEGMNDVDDVSPDGSRLVVLHYVSSTNTDLYLVETASGRVTHLTPHEGDVYWISSRFSGDGRSLYFITDEKTDGTRRVARRDLATGRTEFLEPGARWEAEELDLSPDGRYLAWVENADGYGVPRLRDLEEERELPAPPLRGMAGSVTLTRDGVLLFTYSSPTRTSDVYKWDPRGPELRRLTQSSYAGVDPALFVEPKLVHYPSFDGREIPAFLYLPPGRRQGPLPFVMHMHGGPEAQFRPEFARHFQYLLLNGYGVFAPNVRGSSGYGREYLALDDYRLRPNAVRDMGEGARWLIGQGYTDARHLAVKGGSYGGYMTLAGLVEFPELFAAGVDEVGIADYETFLENTKDYRRALREVEYGPLTDREFLRSISPIHRVDRMRAPLLIIHGENDPRVPVGEARQIAAALIAQGGQADTLIFPDEGHGAIKLVNRLTGYRRMVDFLDRHLKGAGAPAGNAPAGGPGSSAPPTPPGRNR